MYSRKYIDRLKFDTTNVQSSHATQAQLRSNDSAIESIFKISMPSILLDWNNAEKYAWNVDIVEWKSQAYHNKYASHRTISNYYVKRNNILEYVKCFKNCRFVTFCSGVYGDVVVVKRILWAFGIQLIPIDKCTLHRNEGR